MTTKHGWTCGRGIARQVRDEGGDRAAAAYAVRDHCGVSLLRAHRTSHGYTLAEAAGRLREVLHGWGTPAQGLGHQRLSRWENGLDVPSPRYLKALCFLYRTRPDLLGFGYDFSEVREVRHVATARYVSGPDGDAMRRRTFLQGAAAGTVVATLQTSSTARGILPAFDYTAGIDDLETRAEASGYELYTTDPAQFIPQRMVDLAAVQSLLLKGPMLNDQRRLYRLLARNAGFIGIRMTDVADVQDTFAWFRMAGRAAGQADDTGLQAWVAGHIADAYACFGHTLKLGLENAQAAQTLGRGRAGAATVFGLLVEAGLQARLGRRREAVDAVRRADRMYSVLPSTAKVADGTKVTEYFLRWHQSNALTAVGEDRLATEMRARALDLPFAGRDRVGRALLHLDHAQELARSGSIDEACDTVMTTWHDLPGEFRVGQVPRRIVQIVDGFGPHQASARSARALSEYLRSVRTAQST